jgi:Ca2+-binding RTX toxin-like protein
VRTSIGGTLGLNLENLVLTGLDLTGNGNAANNVITGGAGNDSLFGDAGNDTLHGGEGNDTIDGGLGIDSMAGGAGDDTYAIDIATDKFSEALNSGTDTLVTPFTTVMPANFENLTLSGTNNVNATGNDLGNVLAGNTGNNLLDGKGGHDSLAGGDGNDTLNGGLGNDTLAGGAGDDRFIFDGAGDEAEEAFGEGTDTLETPVNGTTLGANIENLVLTGTALTGNGNELDNLLAGNAGANTLSGGDGNDTLSGGAGADSLSGGEGNDSFLFDPADTAAGAISGGTGNDSLVFTGAGQTLNLTLAGVSERFDSIERIDIGGQGATPIAPHINTLIFDFDDIRDLSEESDIVRIDGDLFDVVRSEHNTGTEHWELLGVIEDPVASGVFYIEYQYQYPNLTLITLQVNLDLDQFIS